MINKYRILIVTLHKTNLKIKLLSSLLIKLLIKLMDQYKNVNLLSFINISLTKLYLINIAQNLLKFQSTKCFKFYKINKLNIIILKLFALL
jgi:hypothetical protein